MKMINFYLIEKKSRRKSTFEKNLTNDFNPLLLDSCWGSGNAGVNTGICLAHGSNVNESTTRGENTAIIRLSGAEKTLTTGRVLPLHGWSGAALSLAGNVQSLPDLQADWPSRVHDQTALWARC